ncbi:L-serine ammonia-lyase, iron-sulfur-dependent, subunit alpha [Actinomyces bouchesdurhonensis]|uniref:L-serine ammonia-lyase, iron-sulfur-dependent, subunit alpha n=1 Tax=Actinomyces bouchesdurhonensis TaxID=1852361 RepID=UPI0028E42FAA|nr:L-serine ammonia-lyase, iron-sulfur-dependent, subunit alpha [Actinomyces bouchesdurhonensis]
MDLRPVTLDAPVTAYEPTRPTPAAIVSGEVAAHDAPHPLSVFDMFRIGIGPSSSHTVGPMRAGLAFTTELTTLTPPSRITIDLFGSLGATGRGHSTDRAVLLGLAGYDPETVDIATVEAILPTLASTGTLTLPSGTRVPLSIAEDIRFIPRTVLPYHVNALTITATGEDGDTILQRTYYSVGGGFVMLQTNDDPLHPEVSSLASSQAGVGIDVPAPHPFASSAQLLAQCQASGLSVAELVRANEEAVRPRDTVNAYLDRIADTMFDCVDAGTSAAGILPGGLDVPRRARALAGKLAQRLTGTPASSGDSTDEAGAGSGAHRSGSAAWASTTADPMRAMDWVNLFALAVNEENAAGHRVVTAPTNGAAGVIPAVLGYLVTHCPETGSMPGVATGPATQDGARAPLRHIRMTPSPSADTLAGRTDSGDEATASSVEECAAHRRALVHDFLLAATAIGALIKTNASIAGAEVGCQGEVGSASAMAAAGLAQALGGTPQQVENAAEIAMEHSLGLTCDPVAGLVQVPCIERNAIAAVKAINAARMALWGDGRHMVSLDVVIETMRQTGNDMLSKYKETSEGGLAVNVVEC